MSARLGLAHVVVPFFFAGVLAAAACSSSTEGGASGPSSDSPGTAPTSTSAGTPDTPGKDAGTTGQDGGAQDGGYDGGAGSGADASTGPKNPGESCTKGSECKPWDCACNDGSTFKGLEVCQSKKCATQKEACSVACLNSGGWAGP
jgi:hypothetical protein